MIFQMCTEYNGPHTRRCPAPAIHALKQGGPIPQGWRLCLWLVTNRGEKTKRTGGQLVTSALCSEGSFPQSDLSLGSRQMVSVTAIASLGN